MLINIMVLHQRKNNQKHKYRMVSNCLVDSILEKDLGIFVYHRIIGCLNRSIKCKTEEAITPIYLTLVTP